MKRMLSIALATATVAAIATPVAALEDRFEESFYEGLGNKLTETYEESFYEGLGNKLNEKFREEFYDTMGNH